MLAHEQGRDLVIDELNKCKPGTETPLQNVWQVLNGEKDEHTVQLGGLGTFTFRRGQPGIVIGTGNLPKDGQATHFISESFDSRVPSFVIPNFDAEDWQDRIAQVASSLPIPILHRLQAGAWKDRDAKNPSAGQVWTVSDEEDFTKLLFEISTLGMDEGQQRGVKEWQMSQVANWKNVLDATQKLGEFYYQWSQLVDPDSDLLKKTEFADILLEVDNADLPTAKVTPRSMIRHFEQALVIGPDKKKAESTGGFNPARNWNMPALGAMGFTEPVELHFGQRLVNAIMEEIYRTAAQVGKKHLYEQLMDDAKKAGLVGDPAPLAQLLNVDPAKVQGSLAQAKSEQSLHAALLRALHPALGLSDVDEEILPLRQVQAALEQITAQPQLVAEEKKASVLRLPNADIEKVGEQLFMPATAIDLKGRVIKAAKSLLPPERLIDLSTLLTGLAMPVVGPQNLAGLWMESFTDGTFISDEPTAIAENRSKKNFAVTTLFCRKTGSDGNADYQTLQVMRNGITRRTLIVGEEAIPDELYNRLKRVNIVYLPRGHEMTVSRLQSEVNVIPKADQADIVAALLMRNDAGAAGAKTPLADWLAAASEVTVQRPVFLTRLTPAESGVTLRPVNARKAVNPLLAGVLSA